MEHEGYIDDLIDVLIIIKDSMNDITEDLKDIDVDKLVITGNHIKEIDRIMPDFISMFQLLEGRLEFIMDKVKRTQLDIKHEVMARGDELDIILTNHEAEEFASKLILESPVLNEMLIEEIDEYLENMPAVECIY